MFSMPHQVFETISEWGRRGSSVRNQAYRRMSIFLTSPSWMFPNALTALLENSRPSRSPAPVDFFVRLCALPSFTGWLRVYVHLHNKTWEAEKKPPQRVSALVYGSPGPALSPAAFHTSCSPPLQLLPLSSGNKDPTDCPLLPRPYQCGSTWDFPSTIFPRSMEIKCLVYPCKWGCP